MVTKTLREKTLEKQIAIQPKDVKFCKRCVMSNQRPRIVFDEEGVCSACRYADEKKNTIDWKTRENELLKLLDKHRRNDGQWDVLVPCSGGKDASYVAHQLKHRYGMHPLTITWAPLKYTDIGFSNLQNFINSGFNNLLGSSSGKLQRKLARVAFEEVGDLFLPFIYGQMCFPFHMALRLGIKLVFYGENGEAEYGGNPKNNNRSYMPLEDWAEAYWKGTAIDNLIDYALKNKDYFSKKDFDSSDLILYRPPSIEELKLANIQMHWYSYYHKWIPQENYYYSSQNTGFKANPERSEGTYSKYASLDDKTDGFHYYMAFIKFGIGRAMSDAAHEIRDGHITRDEGVNLVRRYDGELPKKYFKETLEYLDLTEDDFWNVVDSFRQPHLWVKANGKWKLKHQVS
ncbi:MAG: N-acetyl sugar amidotransferase [Candidatus Gorgyraea atricola]|nr:N-acetyl sugar amidotransferase [Candidatus Gorgyraea atricola]